MPELAEVERARLDCQKAVEGKVIANIVTREDTIVYGNCTHDELAKSVLGKRVTRVGRLGKYFYLVMQTAPHILLHLGMAGFVSTRGQEPLFYRRKAKNWKNDDGSDWPLRYWKFALTMDDGQEWCFCDSRRLGRIKLIDSGDKDITEVEPLSLLGRDPYLDMPTLEELSTPLLKRKAPIKAVLLNQNGPLCGIGNWLVDEMLFQATIHPAQRSNTLTASQLLALHTQIKTIVDTAVSVNAEHARFPQHWLFKYRWGKGRRSEPRTFTLPDGSLATVTHQTVGGRTSAIVETVQKLLGQPASGDEGSAGEDEGTPDEGSDGDTAHTATPRKSPRKTPTRKPASVKRKRKPKAAKSDSDSDSDLTPVEDELDLPTQETPAGKTKIVKTYQRVKKGGKDTDAVIETEEKVTVPSPAKRARRTRAKVENA